MDIDFSRNQFTDILTRCHNIIRDNDKLSPEAAFDETSKILFIKIQRERADGKVYTMSDYFQEKENYREKYVIDNTPYYQFLFRQTKDKYREEEIFDDYDTIKIREHSFEAIIYCLETMNLATTEDDVKGIAFESFLGKTFRGELGQFFTPRAVVNFMVSVLHPVEDMLVCDPCCGSGGFLISVFDEIRKQIEADKNAGDDDKKERIRKLSTSSLFGVDANARMARVAKMNMIMHGDGHTCVYHYDGLLNINGVFENRFDLILTNPPFGSRVNKNLLISEAERFTDTLKKQRNISLYGEGYVRSLAQVEDHIGRPLLSLFETGKYTNISEVLFIERCLNLLKEGGRMGIVLPDGVLSNENLQAVREYIESRARILFIVLLPDDVFLSSGAAVKSSVMFFQKYTEAEAVRYREVLQEERNAADVRHGDMLRELKQALRQIKGRKERDAQRDKIEKLEAQMHDETFRAVRERLNYRIARAVLGRDSKSPQDMDLKTELETLAKEYQRFCGQTDGNDD